MKTLSVILSGSYQIDKAFEEIYNAYIFVKTSIAFNSIYALVAGIIVTSLIFKITGIVKDMVSEGKGFNVKHFFELGKEYMVCMLVICMLPAFITGFEHVLSFTAEELTSVLAPEGSYDPRNAITQLAIKATEEYEQMSMGEIFFSEDPLRALSVWFASGIGAIGAMINQYIMYIFVAGRYVTLIMLEIAGPIAIACLLNQDTRNSFYIWMKSMFGCFMLYPCYIIANSFADTYAAGLVQTSDWPAWILIIYAFVIKTTLLSTAKSVINKWL